MLHIQGSMSRKRDKKKEGDFPADVRAKERKKSPIRLEDLIPKKNVDGGRGLIFGSRQGNDSPSNTIAGPKRIRK